MLKLAMRQALEGGSIGMISYLTYCDKIAVLIPPVAINRGGAQSFGKVVWSATTILGIFRL